MKLLKTKDFRKIFQQKKENKRKKRFWKNLSAKLLKTKDFSKIFQQKKENKKKENKKNILLYNIKIIYV
jgi:RNase P protein component